MISRSEYSMPFAMPDAFVHILNYTVVRSIGHVGKDARSMPLLSSYLILHITFLIVVVTVLLQAQQKVQ